MNERNNNNFPVLCSLEPPTLEQTMNKIIEYTEWWKDKPQPYRGVALGQLNHTKRRLQIIIQQLKTTKEKSHDKS